MKNAQTKVDAASMTGGLLIDKPKDHTSHDVVARVRRAAGSRRVGHSGTLDPFATGVLVCCLGRATRLIQFLVGLDKEYVATVRLGFATDTQDATGKQITAIRSSKDRSLEELRELLEQFTGPQLQTPPMFSAKKVGGEKLYRAARAGREIEREPVSITIHSIEMIEDDGPTVTINEDSTLDFRIRVHCSSGTYVRTLAHDIGARLETGAHLVELRRTAVGRFRIADALKLDKLEAMSRDYLCQALISPSEMLSHLPMIALDDERVSRVRTGRGFPVSETEAAAQRRELPIRLCDRTGKLIGVGQYDEGIKLVSPRVVLEVEGI